MGLGVKMTAATESLFLTKHVSKIFNIISTKSYPGNLIQIIGDGGVTKPSILRRYAEFSIIYFYESKIPCFQGMQLKVAQK